MGEGQKPNGLDGKEEKEKDRALAQMQRTQAHVFVRGLLMDSWKYYLEKKCP